MVPIRLPPSLPSLSSRSSAQCGRQRLRTGRALEAAECNPDLGRCPDPNAQQWVLLTSDHSLLCRTALQRAGGGGRWGGALSNLPIYRQNTGLFGPYASCDMLQFHL